MNVNLGSVEVDDETARLIHRVMNPLSRARRARATRIQIRAWAHQVLAAEAQVLREVLDAQDQS